MGKTINENEGSGEGDREMGEDGDAYCAKDNIPRGKDTTIRAETFVALVV